MRLPETTIALCSLEAVLSLQRVPGPFGRAYKRARTSPAAHLVVHIFP
jgi:hypothetical protein